MKEAGWGRDRSEGRGGIVVKEGGGGGIGVKGGRD